MILLNCELTERTLIIFNQNSRRDAKQNRMGEDLVKKLDTSGSQRSLVLRRIGPAKPSLNPSFQVTPHLRCIAEDLAQRISGKRLWRNNGIRKNHTMSDADATARPATSGFQLFQNFVLGTPGL